MRPQLREENQGVSQEKARKAHNNISSYIKRVSNRGRSVSRQSVQPYQNSVGIHKPR